MQLPLLRGTGPVGRATPQPILARRLAGVVAFVFVGMATLGFVIMPRVVDRSSSATARASARLAADVVAGELSRITASGEPVAEEQLEELADREDIVRLVLYDTDGRAVVSVGEGGDEAGETSTMARRVVGSGETIAHAESARIGGRKLHVVEVYAPVVDAQGEVTGVFELYADDGERQAALRSLQVHILSATAIGLVLLALLTVPIVRRLSRDAERRAQEQRWRDQHDPLTGLVNRTHFEQRVDDRLRLDPRRPIHLAMVDLEGFRTVNELFGHDVGDRVLAEVGSRLRALVPDTALVARFDGDEFVICIEDHPSLTTAGLSTVIEHDVLRPVDIDGAAVGVTAHIAVLSVHARTGGVRAALGRLDALMGDAKADRHLRRDGDEAEPGDRRNADLLRDLQDAIAARALTVEYQPIVWLTDRRIVAAEALIRWHRDDGTSVSPADFIPLAERSPVLRPLTRYVLGEVARHRRQLIDAGLHIALSVNISARSLSDVRFVEDVLEHFDGLAADARCPVALEITETAVVEDPATAARVLSVLREAGLRVALDDFGAGQTALGQLAELPLDTVKLDRSLLVGLDHEPHRQVLVRGILRVTEDLGVRAIVEGIETEGQARIAAALGCRYAQGFAFDRSMPITTLAEKLRSQLRLTAPVELRSVAPQRPGADRAATTSVSRPVV